MKAMILAAGFGTRLKPLTLEVPKPMLPVLGRPLLHYHFMFLKSLKIDQVAINLHYLPERIKSFLGREYLGIRVFYFYEPFILGTAGGILNALEFFKGEDFLVINSDIIHDFDLCSAIEFHKSKGALMTMILRKDPQAEKYGVIEVDREGRVLGLLGRSFIEGRRFYSVMFSGVQILSADIKRFLPTKGCIIRETLVRLLQSGALVMGYIDSGYWSELGSVAGYYKVVMELLSGQASLRYMDLSSLRDKNLSLKHSEKISLFSPYYIGSGCEIGVGSVIGPSAVLEDGCKIGKDSKVRGSIIWPQVYFRGEIVNKVKSRYAMVAIT